MSSLFGVQHVARHVASTYATRGRAGTSATATQAQSVAKLLLVALVQVPLSYAAPLLSQSVHALEEADAESPEGPGLWAYLGTAIALVLLGGAFAGLTIALMGQDEIYLQVIATSGEGSEKKHATRVLNLLNKGKHWVLVTLLLSNVITNETLPIVLDRSLGGGWPAVVGSTVLIVIFGEIAPQSVCVRYGLPIGAFMSPFVLALMWLMAPIAWPTAKLLDWLLGEDHGTVYKKAGLKTLVTLHKTLGTAPGERLNEDEVTIISAVLDLKDKSVGDIMTPMNDVFTMSADTILDEKMMDTILSQGYSRIPIYAPENPRNFIGMLLVKILITYDPEDCMRVRDFSLATLPETAPRTSCLDIVNFFQEGKSHMVLISDFPGQDRGALGVVTLEDVIEELIGEEIIDESDVFVDVHRAIRRMAPAPRTKYSKGNVVTEARDYGGQESEQEASESDRLIPKTETAPGLGSRKSSLNDQRETTFLMRRSSGSSTKDTSRPVAVRSSTVDMRPHLRHLGPSNVASRPKATKYTSVKIKPGIGTIPEGGVPAPESSPQPPKITRSSTADPRSSSRDGSGAGLLSNVDENSDTTGHSGQGYGTMAGSDNGPIAIGSEEKLNKIVQEETEHSSPPKTAAEASALAANNVSSDSVRVTGPSPSPSPEREPKENESKQQLPEKLVIPSGGSRPGSSEGPSNDRSRDNGEDSDSSESTLGELGGGGSRRPSKARRAGARSGSISENVVDVGGMKKLVLETNSSSDTEDGQKSGQGADEANNDEDEGRGMQNGHGGHDEQNGAEKRKKPRRKRGGKKVREREANRTSNGDENGR